MYPIIQERYIVENIGKSYLKYCPDQLSGKQKTLWIC